MRLLFLNGQKAGSYYLLASQKIRIGRETDNDIQLLVGGVSRYHARIAGDNRGNWLISDLGSTNGTKVNGRVINGETALHEGDLVLIGDQEVKIVGDEELSAGKTASAEKKSVIPPVIKPLASPGKNKAVAPKPAPVQFHSGASVELNREEKKKNSVSLQAKNRSGKNDTLADNPEAALLDDIFNDTPAAKGSVVIHLLQVQQH